MRRQRYGGGGKCLNELKMAKCLKYILTKFKKASVERMLKEWSIQGDKVVITFWDLIKMKRDGKKNLSVLKNWKGCWKEEEPAKKTENDLWGRRKNKEDSVSGKRRGSMFQEGHGQ